jgi:hypothetical protein
MTTLLMTANQINNQQKTESGGAGGLRGDDTTRDKDKQTTIKQIMWEGGLDGDKDNEDHDNDDDGGGHVNDDDDDGRFSGWDGHHRMRKGRGHDDRTKHNNQIDHRRGGGRRWGRQ